MPLALITPVLIQLKYLHFFIATNDAKDFAKKVSDGLQARLTNITSQDLKDTPSDIMNRTV